jgi:hypothetical protein
MIARSAASDGAARPSVTTAPIIIFFNILMGIALRSEVLPPRPGGTCSEKATWRMKPG